MIKKFAIFGILGVLSACAGEAPRSSTSTQLIDRTFTVVNFGTKSGNTDLSAAVNAVNKGGKVMICAAASAKGEKSFEASWPPAILDNLRVFIGEDQILSQAVYGASYPGKDSLVGRQANCAVTGLEWKPTYNGVKPRIRLGPIRLRT